MKYAPTVRAQISDLRPHHRRKRDEPTIITRHGKAAVVVVSFEEWERLSSVPSFGRLLMAAPIGEDDVPERDPLPPRQADV